MLFTVFASLSQKANMLYSLLNTKKIKVVLKKEIKGKICTFKMGRSVRKSRNI